MERILSFVGGIFGLLVILAIGLGIWFAALVRSSGGNPFR